MRPLYSGLPFRYSSICCASTFSASALSSFSTDWNPARCSPFPMLVKTLYLFLPSDLIKNTGNVLTTLGDLLWALILSVVSLRRILAVHRLEGRKSISMSDSKS